MGRCRALLLALTLGILSGCSGERVATSSSFLSRLRPFQTSPPPDAVHLDVALVQIPYADAARYGELWTFLDEQAVNLEKKSTLEDNGFRVGRVGATPPEELRELVNQRRNCPDPRRIQMQPGKEDRVLDLGTARPHVAFQVIQGEQTNNIDLENAQCCLSVTPTLTDDGRTRLQIVPKIKHEGKNHIPWLPLADRSGWTRQMQQPSDTFPDLGWDVVLAPGEYLVIGARDDRPGTLGHEAFVRPDEKPVPVKRLLVLRAWRPVQDAKLAGIEHEGSTGRGHAPPLAIQAGWSARGSSQ
jgi:hypothetical protein